jgi:hypothetical protein
LANFDQSGLANIREHGVNRGGLYGFFVKGQVLTSTFDNKKTSSSDSLEEPAVARSSSTSTSPSTCSESELDSGPSTASDSQSYQSPTPSDLSANMGRPRQNGGRMKRNTNLVNGANSMPLGTNNRMTALQGGGENKRKRSEEPAEAPTQIEKKGKWVSDDAKKPAYQLQKKAEVIAVPIAAPIEEKKLKKVQDAEPATQLVVEPAKVKKSKKDIKIEPVVEPVVMVSVKEKSSKKKRKSDVLPEPVVELSKERKKSKKEVELAEEKLSSEASESSDLDSETELSSNSDSNSDSDSDSGSGLDSELDLDSDTDTLDLTVEDSTDDEMYAEIKPASNTTTMPRNIIKVVDGIHIPAPESLIREKKQKKPARVIREERKEAREEEARRIAIANKKKAIEDGTFDFAADARRKKERQVDRIVRSEIIRRENQGEFGPKLPHPAVLLKIEKEIIKDLKKQGLEGDEEAEKKAMHARLIVIIPCQ